MPAYLVTQRSLVAYLAQFTHPSFQVSIWRCFQEKKKFKCNYNAILVKTLGGCSHPMAVLNSTAILRILNISSPKTPRGWGMPRPCLGWKGHRSLTMNSRWRWMGPKPLIQTVPLSLLGCLEEQQSWTRSDGNMPAKHFGTCQDMKGSNETHFAIHQPRALSRHRFCANILTIYPGV